MATKPLVLAIFLIGLLAKSTQSKLIYGEDIPDDFSRRYFPDGFIFGAATSAYQIEGEANRKGRGPSVFDEFAKTYPERIRDGSNGDVAVDFYNRYKEDIATMKKMGFDAFRFSLSWSRLIPTGRIRDGINEEGVNFYNRVIDEIVANGLIPFATIFHWDTPQALEDKYGGFLSPDIVDDFHDYSDLVFDKFGDRVKHWMTLNEPWSVVASGYDTGLIAPGRCSPWMNHACPAGNSATEPYIVAHHMILCHATAYRLYKEKYNATEKGHGKIGLTHFAYWYEPYSKSAADREAAKVATDLQYGLFMDPLTFGHYPARVQALVGERLPKFTLKQSQFVKGTYDFVGVQYYSSMFAKANNSIDPKFINYGNDSQVLQTVFGEDGQPLGPPAPEDPAFYIYPKGLRKFMNYVKHRYNNPTLYVTENGVDGFNDKSKPLEEALKDPWRTDYYKAHMWNVLQAIKGDDVSVKGYFAWSYLDNYEWSSGYIVRFGLYYVDYEKDLTRYPKESAKWFETFLKNEAGVLNVPQGFCKECQCHHY